MTKRTNCRFFVDEDTKEMVWIDYAYLIKVKKHAKAGKYGKDIYCPLCHQRHTVYDFKWKADKSRSYGVIAHELQEVLPQAVIGEKDAEEMQSVDYSKIVPLLVKSIQELKAEIDRCKQNKCECKN